MVPSIDIQLKISHLKIGFQCPWEMREHTPPLDIGKKKVAVAI